MGVVFAIVLQLLFILCCVADIISLCMRELVAEFSFIPNLQKVEFVYSVNTV